MAGGKWEMWFGSDVIFHSSDDERGTLPSWQKNSVYARPIPWKLWVLPLKVTSSEKKIERNVFKLPSVSFAEISRVHFILSSFRRWHKHKTYFWNPISVLCWKYGSVIVSQSYTRWFYFVLLGSALVDRELIWIILLEQLQMESLRAPKLEGFHVNLKLINYTP